MSFFSGFPLMGTAANALAIFACSCLGSVLQSRISKDIMKLPIQCIGLFTVCIGMSMALKMQNLLVLAFSLGIGAMIGGFVDIDGYVERIAGRVQSRYKDLGSNFSKGFITATLVFCIGSMAVLGSFEEGLGGYPSLLFTKSMMDGIMSLALSSTLGIGVAFSAIPVILYQGTLTLAASVIQPYLTESAIVEMSAVGGVLLVGMGFVILDMVKIKLMNALPSLIIAVIITIILG